MEDQSSTVEQRQCPLCGELANVGFRLCPHCGQSTGFHNEPTLKDITKAPYVVGKKQDNVLKWILLVMLAIFLYVFSTFF